MSPPVPEQTEEGAPVPEQARIAASSLAPPVVPQAGGLCLGIRKDGGECHATPGADGFCFQHSPKTTSEMRTEAGRRGQQSAVRKHSRNVLDGAIQEASLAVRTTRETLIAAGIDIPDLSTLAGTRAALEDTVA